MGRRGPKPESAALKIAKGNPGKRPVNPKEVAALKASGEPDPPTWLSAEAKAEWARRVPQLAELGVIGAVDQAVLAAYCEAWALWRQALTMLRRRGKVIKPKGAPPYLSPFVKMERDARADVIKLAREIGLTPSSRAGLKIEAPAEADGGLDDFNAAAG